MRYRDEERQDDTVQRRESGRLAFMNGREIQRLPPLEFKDREAAKRYLRQIEEGRPD
jgi:hypothetical protein